MGAAPSIRCLQSPGERHDARLSGACACGSRRRRRANAARRRAVAAAGAGRAAAAEHDAAHRPLAAGPVPRRLAALVIPPQPTMEDDGDDDEASFPAAAAVATDASADADAVAAPDLLASRLLARKRRTRSKPSFPTLLHRPQHGRLASTHPPTHPSTSRALRVRPCRPCRLGWRRL